jgi:rRNA maturation protein Nop10
MCGNNKAGVGDMSMKNGNRIVLSALAVCVLALAIAGCHGIPPGTMQKATIGSVTIEATGAGIVKADAQTTTFKIKCKVCGFEADSITIPTPPIGKPYTMTWTCPKCGHVQKIIIQTVGGK